MKSTKLPGWEGGTLALGFPFCNLLNHPTWGYPETRSPILRFELIFYNEQCPSGILGCGNNGSSRMIQLRAELKC
jgi:hypothetical protein